MELLFQNNTSLISLGASISNILFNERLSIFDDACIFPFEGRRFFPSSSPSATHFILDGVWVSAICLSGNKINLNKNFFEKFESIGEQASKLISNIKQLNLRRFVVPNPQPTLSEIDYITGKGVRNLGHSISYTAICMFLNSFFNKKIVDEKCMSNENIENIIDDLLSIGFNNLDRNVVVNILPRLPLLIELNFVNNINIKIFGRFGYEVCEWINNLMNKDMSEDDIYYGYLASRLHLMDVMFELNIFKKCRSNDLVFIEKWINLFVPINNNYVIYHRLNRWWEIFFAFNGLVLSLLDNKISNIKIYKNLLENFVYYILNDKSFYDSLFRKLGIAYRHGVDFCTNGKFLPAILPWFILGLSCWSSLSGDSYD